MAKGTRRGGEVEKLSKERSCFMFTFHVLAKACLVLLFGTVRSEMYCLKVAVLKRNLVGHDSPNGIIIICTCLLCHGAYLNYGCSLGNIASCSHSPALQP